MFINGSANSHESKTALNYAATLNTFSRSLNIMYLIFNVSVSCWILIWIIKNYNICFMKILMK